MLVIVRGELNIQDRRRRDMMEGYKSLYVGIKPGWGRSEQIHSVDTQVFTRC